MAILRLLAAVASHPVKAYKSLKQEGSTFHPCRSLRGVPDAGKGKKDNEAPSICSLYYQGERVDRHQE